MGESRMLMGLGHFAGEDKRRGGAGCSALNRLLDPTNTAVTLKTLDKAASVLGRKIRLELV